MFGGTFNPVHNGHVRLCRTLAEKISADRVIIVPAFSPVHKDTGKSLADASDRMQMCELAFDGDNETVSDIEISQGRPCYSFETLERLHEMYPDSRLYMACGSDMFLTLHSWRSPEKIYALATVCVMSRGDDCSLLCEYEKAHRADGLNALIVDMPPVKISSTQVRAAVRAGESIDALVPPKVAQYIAQRRLYLC